MPKAYSLDLRQRAARFVEGGRSCHAAAAHFRVSISFVVRLMKSFRTTGSLQSKPSGGRRHAKLDPHKAFLLGRIAEKPDMTMPELSAELSKATGTRADPASLSRFLIRNGYRFKKNPAGKRARSLRYQGGARGMDHHTPAAHAARAASSGLSRRDRNDNQDDALARSLSEGPAASLQSAFRTLDDPDFCRWLALR
jgi:transposase